MHFIFIHPRCLHFLQNFKKSNSVVLEIQKLYFQVKKMTIAQKSSFVSKIRFFKKINDQCFPILNVSFCGKSQTNAMTRSKQKFKCPNFGPKFGLYFQLRKISCHHSTKAQSSSLFRKALTSSRSSQFIYHFN